MSANENNNGALLKRRLQKWGKMALKIILSTVTVFSFIMILRLMQWWYATSPLLAGTYMSLAKPPPLPENQGKMAASDAAFWPHFPGSPSGSPHRITINGVDTLGENWPTTASAEDVIAFYREQMLARGWQDKTEEYYNLQPEFHGDGMGDNGLQNTEYITRYRFYMDSSLILNRNGWSLQFIAVPVEKGIHQTNVRIFAAATPSIKDFSESFGMGDLNPAGGGIDAVENSRGQRWHTRIITKNEEPLQVFNAMLKEYRDNNWRALVYNPSPQKQSGYVAWLVKGQSYAGFAVKAIPQGKGSTVTLTEVTPDLK